jgi:hypothetical protein
LSLQYANAGAGVGVVVGIDDVSVNVGVESYVGDRARFFKNSVSELAKPELS